MSSTHPRDPAHPRRDDPPWRNLARLALLALLFVGAVVLGLTVGGRSAPSSAPATTSPVAEGPPASPDHGDDGQHGDEPDADPDPNPNPDPGLEHPDDVAPNPEPVPTPPDDVAPNPDPEPDPIGPEGVSAAPEPGTLVVHPNFADVTLQGKGYEHAEHVCFGNPGDLPVNWIVNDGVVVKSYPLNGELEAGAVTCPLVWTDHPSMEPGMGTNTMFESENNFILIGVTLAE